MSEARPCGFGGWWKFFVILGLFVGGGSTARSLKGQARSDVRRADQRARNAEREASELRAKLRALTKRVAALEALRGEAPEPR